MATLLELLQQKVNPDAQDRYLKTPINYKDDLLSKVGAYGEYVPPITKNIGNGIFLDKSLQNKDQNTPFINYWDKNQGNSDVDANDVLRHEILHAAMNKYGVDNTTPNYSKDTSGGFNDWVRGQYNPRERITGPLTSLAGNYLHGTDATPEQTKKYQQYLLHSLANSPGVHPKFKELLKRMGYGI